MVFSSLSKRILMNVELKTETTLHIGSGEREEFPRRIDLPVLRLSDKRIFIPGSSIKGVLRSETERFLSGLGFKLCIERKGWEPIYETCDEEVACVSCAMFGSTRMASRVICRDALGEDVLETTLKSGIALNRQSKTVRPGALFTAEYINPGSIFESEIIFENPEDGMLGLLFTVLESLPSLGGQVSRGAGKVDVSVKRIEIQTARSIAGVEEPKMLEKESLDKFINDEKQRTKQLIEDLKRKYIPP